MFPISHRLSQRLPFYCRISYTFAKNKYDLQKYLMKKGMFNFKLKITIKKTYKKKYILCWDSILLYV